MELSDFFKNTEQDTRGLKKAPMAIVPAVTLISKYSDLVTESTALTMLQKLNGEGVLKGFQYNVAAGDLRLEEIQLLIAQVREDIIDELVMINKNT